MMTPTDLLKLNDAQLVRAVDHTDPGVYKITQAVIDGRTTPQQGCVDLRDYLRARDMVRNTPKPAPAPVTSTRVEWGANDHHSAYIREYTSCRLVKDKLITPSEATLDADVFFDKSIGEAARDILSFNGMTPDPDRRASVDIANALAMRGERGIGSDDFPALLENIASKAETLGWDRAPETWMYWTRQTETKNFLDFTRVTAPELPTPALVRENGEIPHATLGSDSKETSAVQSYVELVSTSREALVNDDLQRLTVTSEAAGRAMNRKVGDLAYAVLTDNAAMTDTVALFHGTHANLGTGGVPSTTTMDEIRALMAAQLGPSGENLNISPAIVIGPRGLESSLMALTLANYNWAPDNVTGDYQAGRLSVITDGRLTGTAYYAVADPRSFSGVDVVTIAGRNGRPMFERVSSPLARDGISFRLTHDVVAMAVDYRSVAKNAGA